jgi:hypothetical protein
MTIAFGVVRDVRVGVIEALRVAARHLGSILLIAARLVVRVIITGGTISRRLRPYLRVPSDRVRHQFYLTKGTPVFWVAVALIVMLLLVLAAILVPRLIRWAYALPLHLFDQPRDDLHPRVAGQGSRKTSVSPPSMLLQT